MKHLQLAFLLFAATAFCDQAIVVARKPADRAASILKTTQAVIHFCARCEDDKPVRELVKKVEVKPWNGGKAPGQFSVYLNGKDLDLAYVYVEKSGAWTNLARLVNVEVTGVPTVLDSVAPERTEIFEIF